MLMLPETDSFIGEFITRYPAHGIIVKDDVQFPYYKEFVYEEYEVCVDPDGEENLIPAEMAEAHLPSVYKRTGRKEYEYHFNFGKLIKSRDKYPDLVAIFESNKFQPYVDFMALRAYYQKLTANIVDSEDDSLDFLG